MDKTLLLILALFFIIVCAATCTISGLLININNEKQQIENDNKLYESYLNQEIPGTELATLIGKVINENEKNKIEKDENGYYINNKYNSLKIDLKMVTLDKTYPMEEIHNNKIANFVQYFNTVKFKCTSVEYHEKSGKVARLVFEELQ